MCSTTSRSSPENGSIVWKIEEVGCMMVRHCDRCGKKIEDFYTRIYRCMHNQKNKSMSTQCKENDLCMECELAFIKFMEQPKEGAENE